MAPVCDNQTICLGYLKSEPVICFIVCQFFQIQFAEMRGGVAGVLEHTKLVWSWN